jgi:hypothetical protein
MSSPFGSRWLLLLVLAAVVAWGAWLARASMLASTQARLSQRYQQRLAVLPEQQALRLIRELSRSDQWIDALVVASCDERPAVAGAAGSLLRETVDRWTALPVKEGSMRVARLAHVLGKQAPQLAADRRSLPHALAERLIEWPVDGRQVDAARLIADCQSVLLLPRAEPLEASHANLEEGTPPMPTGPADSVEPPAEIRVAATPAAPPQTPPPPAVLPEASTELPVKPRPFSPSGPMRISDDCN